MFNPVNPEFWVMVAFFIFMGLLAYMGVPKLLAKALDDRADGIRRELDEARRLREEAQQLLTDYQKKARDAEAEAKSIIDQARIEAEAMAKETRKGLVESLERRTKQAEDKIARAEAQALSEVRATAVNTAMAAAEKMLKARVPGQVGDNLIDQSIKDLKGKLN